MPRSAQADRIGRAAPGHHRASITFYMEVVANLNPADLVIVPACDHQNFKLKPHWHGWPAVVQ
jgi:hypothetical protein